MTISLEEQIAELEAALAEKAEKINRQAALLQVHEDQECGWLITAANPMYDGSVMGVKFTSGQAFIHRNQELDRFAIKPMSEAALAAYPPAEQEAIREREKITPAERAAKALAADFGYQVNYFGIDEKEERLEIMAARADERKLAELATAEAAKIAKLAVGAH